MVCVKAMKQILDSLQKLPSVCLRAKYQDTNVTKLTVSLNIQKLNALYDKEEIKSYILFPLTCLLDLIPQSNQHVLLRFYYAYKLYKYSWEESQLAK